MWQKGSRRGSIDQCFPSKVAIAHVHNLIFDQPPRKKPDIILFPAVRRLPAEIENAVGAHACPTVSITPDCPQERKSSSSSPKSCGLPKTRRTARRSSSAGSRPHTKS
ncbi:MAG: hypothetical protein IID40_00410 [Planctomycetes bacterium]|nr:hypothetical protein [Planctomycetota bacterium]